MDTVWTVEPHGPWNQNQRTNFRLNHAQAIKLFKSQQYNMGAKYCLEIYTNAIRDPESSWIGDDI